MGMRSEALATQSSTASLDSPFDSIDPLLHLLKFIPYSFLRLPRLRLKLPTLTLPSAMTVYALVLLTYFMVVSGIVYDVIVEPPGIGSTQDGPTGTVRPIVFLPGRVNGQYIIEGLSSGFMFVLGGIGIVLMDLSLDRNRAKSIRVSYASAGISSVVIATSCSSEWHSQKGFPVGWEFVLSTLSIVVAYGLKCVFMPSSSFIPCASVVHETALSHLMAFALP
ncbi:hypothetical protein Ancab_027836 [Ancistrocladus abbreviatus]